MSNVTLKYGQHPFDFNDGIMSFMSPNQVFSIGACDVGKKIENQDG